MASFSDVTPTQMFTLQLRAREFRLCCPDVSQLGAHQGLRIWLRFLSATLLQHPFPDVRRTVQDRRARRLTRAEKTNTFEIDKIQFLQIQNDWRFATLDFGFDLIQVPNSQFAAEPNPPLDPFNPQRHFPPAPEDADGSASRRPFAIACCS